MLTAALAKNPDAICIAALDSKAVIPCWIRPTLQAFPSLGFDSGVDSDIPLATAATDNYAAGGIAADNLAELIGYEGALRSSSTTRPATPVSCAGMGLSTGLRKPIPTSP